MVYLYAIIATIGAAVLSIYSRYVLKRITAHSYAVIANILSGLIFLPIAFSNFSFTKSSGTIWAIVISVGVWSCWTMLNALSNKNTQASIRAPIGQSKLLWVLILGAVFLGEAITFQQVVGVVIIFIGLSILLWHPEYKLGSLKDSGVRWTMITAFAGALTAIVDKNALNFLSIELYGFIAFIVPGIILLLFTPKKAEDIKFTLTNHKIHIVLISLMMVGTYYMTLKTYSLLPISVAYPFLQLATLITVIAGIFILKEKEHIWQKIIATILVIIGSVIFKIGLF